MFVLAVFPPFDDAIYIPKHTNAFLRREMIFSTTVSEPSCPLISLVQPYSHHACNILANAFLLLLAQNQCVAIVCWSSDVWPSLCIHVSNTLYCSISPPIRVSSESLLIMVSLPSPD